MPSEPWQPTPAPSTPEPSAPLTSRPAPTGTFMPQTFTPEPANGPFDDEVTNMLAQRADIAQQALAELSQLSSYRPQQVSGAASSLVRRTPAAVPAAPEIETRPAGQRPERDANQVRSLLSSFQSGTTRGRQAGAPDGPQTTGVGASHTGTEDGLTGGHDV
ncbi:hypothetical protein N868_03320 [Cellulomonas carbonis T26]|uniref:Uncharacterized protein n=1 Tax=Cellulomonas carbonis T26 TaxID=947969 RepID=A0A0A0BMZ2_9CELL|nr:hypothetical protein N868_03320 [Cellulomonas carbonis T26]